MKGFLLTHRDRDFLKKLYSMGLMTTRQIEAAMFPGIDSSTVLRRLRKLHNQGYLVKEPGLRNGPFVWTLSTKSSRLLGSDLIYGSVNRNTLEHETHLAEIRLRLEKVLTMELWVPGHELKKRAARARGEYVNYDLVPDAIFYVLSSDKKIRASFILELELALKSKNRYRNIFHKYARKKGEFWLWYVVPHKRFGEKLITIWLREIGDNSQGKRFVWTTLDELLHDPLNAKCRLDQKTFCLKELLQNEVGQEAKRLDQNISAEAAQPDDHPQSIDDDLSEDCPEDYPNDSTAKNDEAEI